MALPTPEEISTSLLEARTREFDATTFTVGTAEYRLASYPGLPASWAVWVSNAGDLVIDKGDGRDLIRLRTARPACDPLPCPNETN